MRILSADRQMVASYTYDAWGKVISASGSMAQINPIRYRSYYYDKETSLYYLQSRYYDPETGRFLNADGLLGANQDLLSYNLYAYCSNNPINCSDPTGQFALGILVAGLAALTFAAVGASLLAAGGIAGAQAAQKQLQGTPHYNPPAARPFPTYNDIMNNPAVGIAPSGAAAAQAKEEEKEKTKGKKSNNVIIYRYYSSKRENLSPRLGIDYDGLSFSTKPPRPGVSAVATTIEAVNATGVLIAIPTGGNHVSVIPATGTVTQWMSQGQGSVWSQTLSCIVIEWSGK